MTAGGVGGGPGLRVLRISKSGVVTAWRERERLLRARGADLTLVTAVRWEEGGSMVPFTADGDDFVVPVRTLGRHPNLFVFGPVGLWRALGSARWDLIDMHEEPFGLAVAEVLLLCRLRALRTPFVVSSAQNIEKRYPPPFRWFERWSLRRAAGAYTCNVAAGEILRRKGLDPEPVLLPLGVDVQRFQPEDRPPPAEHLRVGFVGRLIPHKGVDVLLEAAAGDARMSVDIFGAGPEADRLAAEAVRLGGGRPGDVPRARGRGVRPRHLPEVRRTGRAVRAHARVARAVRAGGGGGPGLGHPGGGQCQRRPPRRGGGLGPPRATPRSRRPPRRAGPPARRARALVAPAGARARPGPTATPGRVWRRPRWPCTGRRWGRPALPELWNGYRCGHLRMGTVAPRAGHLPIDLLQASTCRGSE